MVDEQKYLGFVLSNKGDNMVNINNMKKKSKGIIRRILVRAACVRCHGTKCPLLTAFSSLSSFSLLHLLFSQKGLL